MFTFAVHKYNRNVHNSNCTGTETHRTSERVRRRERSIDGEKKMEKYQKIYAQSYF